MPSEAECRHAIRLVAPQQLMSTNRRDEKVRTVDRHQVRTRRRDRRCLAANVPIRRDQPSNKYCVSTSKFDEDTITLQGLPWCKDVRLCAPSPHGSRFAVCDNRRMVECGPVEKAVRGAVAPGDKLLTPTQRQPFIVKTIDPDGVVLLLGQKQSPIRLGWDCLEEVVPFIDGLGGDVKIGGKNDVDGTPGTLDEHLKKFTTTNTAGWVAALLSKAGVLEIVDEHPALLLGFAAEP
jgi:hypothetical protein